MVLDFESSGVQLMTLSAHKIYGPKGVGALIVDNALELSPLLLGGGQERGLRAGTENLAAIVGFGAAAELAMTQLTACAARARRLRDRLESGLAAYPEISVFAKNTQRLPNTVQLAVAGIDGETLLMQLDRAGIAVSSGSACSSGKTTPSHVLAAMGVDSELARGAIRVSMGRDSTESDIDVLLAALGQQLKWIQKTSQAAGW
jgi:cysteine desulfurase